MAPTALAPVDLFRAPERDWSVEYGYAPTAAQEQALTEWFGHGRLLRNTAVHLSEAVGPDEARSLIDSFVAENPFLFALPPTALAAARDALLASWSILPLAGHVSRTRSLQTVALGPEDFELTARATLIVTGLGEVAVHFDEGVPEPGAAIVEFRRDPSAPHGRRDTVRLNYRGVPAGA